jgi:hypothetical protein
MVSAKPSTEDEAAFMNDLLANFDIDAFFNTRSSPVSSPVKTDLLRTRSSAVNLTTPVKSKPEKRAKKSPVKPIAQVGHFAFTDDLVGLLDDLGDCGWKDMEADFLSPKKLTVKPSEVRL